ncbi:MAG: hypothetical protein DRN29_03630 [Thermoplasmata archaeon]|nr:MAG: hypothetical protein DRN29_03630 [Thermoplasmata archaeon]
MESRLPAILFILGIALLLIAFVKGEAEAGIFIIFPFIAGSGILSFFGMLLIFLSFILFIFSFPLKSELQEAPMPAKMEKKTGGIVFIGPIPVIFSSDLTTAKILIIVATIILFLFLLLFLLSL